MTICHCREGGNPGGGVGPGVLRPKQLKKWKRAWRIRLIEEKNPGWEDLYPLLG